jgi:hypothetical protein
MTKTNLLLKPNRNEAKQIFIFSCGANENKTKNSKKYYTTWKERTLEKSKIKHLKKRFKFDFKETIDVSNVIIREIDFLIINKDSS